MSAFFLELLLYSGQYGAFYLLANFVNVGFSPSLAEESHLALMAALVLQCYLQSRYGDVPLRRFLLSLAVPTTYFFAELIETPDGLANMGHAFFWIFSISI